MHLNDAFILNSEIETTFMHHEQALSMAADGYARVSGRPAIVNVTSGPGGINALNGVFGAFVDSIPMVVVSGQVRTETIARLSDLSLRQLGDQEADVFSMVKSSVKYFAMPVNKFQVIVAIENMIRHLTTGRHGPVWIDITIDVQGVDILNQDLKNFREDPTIVDMVEWTHPNTLYNEPKIENLEKHIAEFLDDLKKAKRPLLLAGNGVKNSKQEACFLKIISKLMVPTVTGWNAHDLLPNDHPSYCGKPGTVGERSGNFAVRNADLVLVLGCRLNIRQISYNWKSFAPKAKLFVVDIDKYEINKPTLNVDVKLHYDLADFLINLNSCIRDWIPTEAHLNYLKFCRDRLDLYPVVTSKHYSKHNEINPYAYFNELYKSVTSDDIVVLGNGSACVIGFQTSVVKRGLKLFSNSGCASMGFDLPASIGAALSNDQKPKRVICVAGDGSIMMNIQELATVAFLNLPIKIFVLDNGGYHSIVETQKRNFSNNTGGTCPQNGLGFPNFLDVSRAFGIKSSVLSSISDIQISLKSKNFLDDQPYLFIVKLDKSQNFEPKLQSKRISDGSMVSPELHDMAPFLSKEELEKNLIDKK